MPWGEVIGGILGCIALLAIGAVVAVEVMKDTRAYRAGEQVLEEIGALQADQELAEECERKMHEVADQYREQRS